MITRVENHDKIMPGPAQRRRYYLAVIISLFVICPVEAGYAAVEQPAGYRMEQYDAEVPDALDGASVIFAAGVKQLQQTSGAVVVDVIPEQRRPAVLPENQIWIPVKHKGIPGAIWLPDVGYGVLSDITEQYFKRHLERTTEADKSRPVVFYCRSDCWMSWNAAKRALTYGYTNVYWFAEGIDGWLLEGFEFDVLQPAAGRRQQSLTTE